MLGGQLGPALACRSHPCFPGVDGISATITEAVAIRMLLAVARASFDNLEQGLPLVIRPGRLLALKGAEGTW